LSAVAIDQKGHVEESERARILLALAEVMSEREIHSITVKDVAARAGVSQGAFNELFADLEGCFLAAFELGVRRGRAALAAAYIGESSWADGIRAGLVALLQLLEEEPVLARLWIVYSLGGGPRVLRRRSEVIQVLCEFVDRGRLEGVVRTEPPELTAEGVVGAVLAIVQARLLARDPEPLGGLLGQLMSLIMLPYLGTAAAKRELKRSIPRPPEPHSGGRSAVEGLGMRLTHRTACVLMTLAEHPGASNREVADRAGIVDQGQISKLLSRLEGLGLIVNVSQGGFRGAPNAWTLTPRGAQVEQRVRRGVGESEHSLPQ
jgi:AcrR family transcriptional regulator/DNA-binding MarR family transcriptional regulator